MLRPLHSARIAYTAAVAANLPPTLFSTIELVELMIVVVCPSDVGQCYVSGEWPRHVTVVSTSVSLATSSAQHAHPSSPSTLSYRVC